MRTYERVLLDTHAYAWLVSEPDKLSDTARDVVVDIDTEVFVSAASLWEMATKTGLGKWPGGQTLVSTFESRVQLHDLSKLVIDFDHTQVAGQMDWDHRDPFDRMLAAQSMLENLPLVTKDSRLRDLDRIHTIW
ncbi:MAG: type II toxin-antitoxin system VapC family toxin [Nocardioides sp.]|nr:type II toxin-antitoxin system VapC family toxin [Nocardioides sp.]